MTDQALEIHHLSVNYDKTPVLWDISLQIPQGTLVGIVGPNGAGKSTLIKAVLDLIPSTSGKVTFFGQNLKDVRTKVAYVPQRESIDWDFPITVLELVVMGRYGSLGLFCWPKKQDYEQARKYLEKVGMEHFADRQISQLSGGQQQRVFLARALLQEADVYFMDEPFSGVDMGTEQVIVSLLREMQKEGKTVFVVHHDLNTVDAYFDWVILLNMRLVTYGPVKEHFTKDNVGKAYGKNFALFDEALRLSQTKTAGLK
jgi:manganese/zinc/iron transport system ATP- binding protein